MIRRIARTLPGLLSYPLFGCVVAFAAAAPAADSPEPADSREVSDLVFRTYLYARLGDREKTLETGARVFETHPEHPDVLLAFACLWESEKEPERLNETTLRLLASLRQEDRSVLFFKAASDFELKRFSRARFALLEGERIDFGTGREFPFHSLLADSAMKAGDWNTAIHSRALLLADGGADRALAVNRMLYDSLLLDHSRVLTAEAGLNFAPARHTASSFHFGYAENAGVHTRVSADLESRTAALSEGGGWGAASRVRRAARLGLEYLIDETWSVSGSLGADDGGEPDASATLIRKFSSGKEFSLSATYAAPVDDDAPYLVRDIRRSGLLATGETLQATGMGGKLSGGLRCLHEAGDAPQEAGWVLSGELSRRLPQRLPQLTPYVQTIWTSNPVNAPVTSALTALRNDDNTADVEGAFDLEKAGVRAELPLRTRVILSSDIHGGVSIMSGSFLYGALGQIRWSPVKTLVLLLGSGWDNGTIFGEFPSGVARAHLAANWYF